MFNIFSKNQDVRCLLNLLENPSSNLTKFVQKNYVVKRSDSFLYVRIDLALFFTPFNANIRPQQLTITLTNLNPDVTKDTIFYYVHTPLIETQPNLYKPSDFTNFWSFTKSFDLNVSTPYLTCVLKDDNGRVNDIDLSQLTNVNLLANRVPDVSFGGLYILPNRCVDSDITYQVQYKLLYLENKY